MSTEEPTEAETVVLRALMGVLAGYVMRPDFLIQVRPESLELTVDDETGLYNTFFHITTRSGIRLRVNVELEEN